MDDCPSVWGNPALRQGGRVMFKNRKGFTLVELLIVIVIIGILAAAMLLSSGSATDSAEASNIISDLRSLKSAALRGCLPSSQIASFHV